MRKGYLIVTLALALAVSGCGSADTKEDKNESLPAPVTEEQAKAFEETVSEEAKEEAQAVDQEEDAAYQYDVPFDKNSLKIYGLSIDDLDTLDSDGFVDLLAKYEIEPKEGEYSLEFGDKYDIDNPDFHRYGITYTPDETYQLMIQYGLSDCSTVYATKSIDHADNKGYLNELTAAIDEVPLPEGIIEGCPVEFGSSYDEVYSFLNLDEFKNSGFTEKVEAEGYNMWPNAWYCGYKAVLQCDEGRSISLNIYEDGDIRSIADATVICYFFSFDNDNKLNRFQIRKIIP